MRSVVMGEKSFRLTGTPAEAVQARAVYDKVRKYVATTPEGAEIRAWLTRELIPERPKDEEHDEAGKEAGEEGAGGGGGASAEVDQDGDEAMEDAKKPISSRRTSSRASSSSPRKKGGGGGPAAAAGAASSSSSGLSHSFTAAVSKAEPGEGEDELDEE